MKKKKLTIGIGFIIFIIIIIFAFYIFLDKNELKTTSTDENNVRLRLAWMTSWAGGGKVVEALIHTDILQNNNVDVEFKKFLFGPPMNEAAITGNVDVTIVGDMPAITLLAASDNWSVVSLTVHFPYALMVRNDLQIEDIIDLKGKTVGVPFGSGPQPTLYRWLEAAGLAINKDVKVKNILPNEIAEAISSRKIDAVMAWEPTMTVLKKDNSARVFREAVGVGFMCMSNDFIDNYPDLVDRFIQSWKEALLFSAKNKLKTVEWFSADSRIPVDILADISIVDDNLKSDKLEDINIVLTEQDINKNQRKADFAYQQNLISKKLDIKKRIIWKFMSPNRD